MRPTFLALALLTACSSPAGGTHSPDSDGDGYPDDDELAAGTDPDNPYSHPYAGDYNVGLCEDGIADGAAGPTGLNIKNADGYQAGDIIENLRMVDQHGEWVDLYSFCGRTVMLIAGVYESEASVDLARTAQEVQDAYPDDLQVILVWSTWEADLTLRTEDMLRMSEDIGTNTVPNLADTDGASSLFDVNGGTPSIAFIAPDMTALGIDTFDIDPQDWLP